MVSSYDGKARGLLLKSYIAIGKNSYCWDCDLESAIFSQEEIEEQDRTSVESLASSVTDSKVEPSKNHMYDNVFYPQTRFREQT
jgi:hypothetical protein